jgi:hypothetical protein
VRGGLEVAPARYDSNRLLAAALVLMCGAIGGWTYKHHVLGGIPLLSDSVDVVRGRAVTATGNSRLPTWSSALTGGSYLALWALLAALWIDWRSASWVRRGVLGVLAAVALFGVALDGSRNLLLLSVAVPLIGAYIVAAPVGRAKTLLRAGAVALVVLAVVGGVFVARLGQTGPGNQGRTFVDTELHRYSPVLRPVLPVYINGVLPFDAYERVHDAVPTRVAWGNGAFSLLSLPDAAFRDGKPNYGGLVTAQMQFGEVADFWAVATYQGRAFADVGPGGVFSVSVLLGLLFGGVYRLARRGFGLFSLAAVGLVAYYSACMTYDNLLSFTLISVYDLAILFAVNRFAQGRWRSGEPAFDD